MEDRPHSIIHPGPYVDDVIRQDTQHRSSCIFHGYIAEDVQLQVRRCGGGFWDHTPVPDRVRDYIRLAGFEGVLLCRCILIDHALVTALVERWRPETHSFHFPVGEATITLQDVEVLWGLPIDGMPIIGVDSPQSEEEWSTDCEELLGFKPDGSDIDRGRLKVRCLLDTLDHPLPDDASDDACKQMARIYILLLLGGHLLSDRSVNKVLLRYLPLLRDLESVGQYSWGSAVLATLYRSLCDATSPTVREISGPLMLLQLWAWERMPTIRPNRMVQEVDHYDGPRGARWKVEFDVHRVARHVLPAIRDQLGSLRPNEFIWQPYLDILDSLPPYCTAGQHIWRSVTFLICWEIIECHVPHRVLRQFGLYQPIPDMRIMIEQDILHTQNHRFWSNSNWSSTHDRFICDWATRHDKVEQGIPIDDTTNASHEYKQWYQERTILYISNPSHRPTSPEGYQSVGARAQYLMDVVSRIYYMTLDSSDMDDHSRERLAALNNFAATTMYAVGELE